MSELSESVFVRQLDADGYQDFLVWLKNKEARIRKDERKFIEKIHSDHNAQIGRMNQQLATAQARIEELEKRNTLKEKEPMRCSDCGSCNYNFYDNSKGSDGLLICSDCGQFLDHNNLLPQKDAEIEKLNEGHLQKESQLCETIRQKDKLLAEVLDDLIELRGERHWWKDEPRCNYQKEYKELCDRIKRIETQTDS